MTLVATFATHQVPAIIGDVLLSGPERPGHIPTLPVIGHGCRIFPRGSGWSIVGLRQKVTVVAPHCVVGWSGSRIAASVVIKDLFDLARKGELAYASVEAYLLSLATDSHFENLALLGWVGEGSGLVRFHFRSKLLTVPQLGRIHVAGSAADVLCRESTGLDLQRLPIGSAASAVEQAMATWLSIVGAMLHSELQSQESLRHYYGGGYEIAVLTAQGFRKLDNVTFVLWLVDASAEETSFVPKAVVKQSYYGDILAIRSVRMYEPDEIAGFVSYEESHVAVPPPHRAVSQSELAKIPVPSLDSAWTCHVGLIRTASPPTVFTLTEYLPAGEIPTCRFLSDDGQFSFTITKGLLSRFNESILAHSTVA